jgi:hypothetical protein
MVDKFIEWDRDRLVVTQGRIEGAKAQFELVRVFDRHGETTDTLALVDQLKQLFALGADRKRNQVEVILPRQMVTIHRIQLPQVPDAEVPDMIRLQAAMRLTVPIESVCLDFTPLPILPGSPTRDVLLVTVPSDQIAIVRRTLNDAGLELASVRVSAYCVAQAAAAVGILRETVDSNSVDVVAVLRRDFIELTFVRGTSVVFSHSGSAWGSIETIEKTLRSELTRARMSSAEILGEHKINRIVLIGGSEVASAVTDQIASRFDNAKIERIDPSDMIGAASFPEGISATDVFTIAGAISGSEGATVPVVDLIHPRKAPEKKDLRRIKVLLSTLAALVLFAGGYFWRQGRLRELTQDRAIIETENQEIKDLLAAGEKELLQFEKVNDWVIRDIEWLDELARLKSILPGNDRIFIDNVSFMTIARNGVANIKLDGYAKSDGDIDTLTRKLVDHGYGVKPFEPEYRASAVSQDYGVKISLELTLPEVSGDADQQS